MTTSDSISPRSFQRLVTRSVAVPSALLAGLAAVFLGQIIYLLSAAEWVDHTDQVIAKASALLKLLVDGETGMRGYLVTADPVFLEPYQVEQNDIGQAFEGLLELVVDNPPQAERLEALRLAHTDWQKYARKMIDLRSGGGDYGAPARNMEGKRRMDAMREQIAGFIHVEQELRDSRSRTVRLATWAVAGVSLVLTLLIGGFLAVFTRRQLMVVSRKYRNALSEAESHAESLRKSADRLQSLHEIDRAILAADSVSELTRSALRRMELVIPSDEALVVFFDLGRGPDQVIFRDVATVLPIDETTRLLTEAPTREFSDQSALHQGADLLAIAWRICIKETLMRRGFHSCLSVPLQAQGKLFGELVLAAIPPSAFTEEHVQVTGEVSLQLSIAIQQALLREQLQRNADELERRVLERTRELQDALENVKKLQGLLPICAWCKKVRDDNDYWHDVETYVSARTEARFSHGMCPACQQNMLETL